MVLPTGILSVKGQFFRFPSSALPSGLNCLQKNFFPCNWGDPICATVVHTVDVVEVSPLMPSVDVEAPPVPQPDTNSEEEEDDGLDADDLKLFPLLKIRASPKHLVEPMKHSDRAVPRAMPSLRGWTFGLLKARQLSDIKMGGFGRGEVVGPFIPDVDHVVLGPVRVIYELI
ncbi:PREDICTED: uncharacterized protein LOC109150062 [Ipomoea nil]|uniref:uncharacterized protein LOC109150062 n=1 Tax=Ipomoea nil TaxID=35883 RepID=UPI0009014726|nr:PREDICTED: uncharacterized protein LOC109150062 [Ipomoea nil]